MTVTYKTSAAAAHGSTSVAPNPGASGVVAADESVLFVGTKPTTATIITPSGWTPLLEVTGGTGVQGTDTGPMRLAAFYREGAWSGAQTVTITGGDSSFGLILTGQRTLDTWAIPVAVSGDDTTGGSDIYSAVMNADVGLTSIDWAVAAIAIPTDASTITIGGGLASPTMSTPGISGGSVVTYYSETATNTHCAVGMNRLQAIIGTSSGATTVGGTFTAATNTYGPSILIRLRDVAGPGPALQTVTTPLRLR